MTRPPWGEYFMGMAHHAASRGTCPRRKVGCVLMHEKRVIATGYNGSLSGTNHCTSVGCMLRDGHCIRAVHAEANAIAQAARAGVRTNGATAYTTTFPCMSCFKLLVQAGVHRILYAESYPHEETKDVEFMAAYTGIELVRLTVE